MNPEYPHDHPSLTDEADDTAYIEGEEIAGVLEDDVQLDLDHDLDHDLDQDLDRELDQEQEGYNEEQDVVLAEDDSRQGFFEHKGGFLFIQHCSNTEQ